jgi:hypothetical protein
MAREPQLIRRDKPTRDEREYGSFYNGVVSSVRDDGRVSVKIQALGVTIGSVMPLNTGDSNHMSKGDTVICTFADQSNSSLIVFGSVSKVIDPFSVIRDEKIRLLMEVW